MNKPEVCIEEVTQYNQMYFCQGQGNVPKDGYTPTVKLYQTGAIPGTLP